LGLSKMDKEVSKWRDRYDVLAPEDHDLLDSNAAVHEFRGGMSKEAAETRAHQNYLRNHALDACAFHYLGMRAALAGQNQSAAKRHGEAYSTAMKHLGYNPLETPPKEVLDRAKDSEKNPYSFKAHQADHFFVPEIPQVKEPTEKEKTLELIEKLKGLRASIPSSGNG